MKVNRLRRLKKGLTLIELSIVVMIIGALIGILISSIDFKSIFGQTEKVKLKADSAKLQGALSQYQAEFGRIPTEEQGLRALIERPTSGDVPENYRPVLKSKDAILDPWKTEYKLKIDSNGDYSILTLGLDKKEGGEGKNKDFNIINDDEYPSDYKK
jgi:general secretion pathway protein G